MADFVQSEVLFRTPSSRGRTTGAAIRGPVEDLLRMRFAAMRRTAMCVVAGLALAGALVQPTEAAAQIGGLKKLKEKVESATGKTEEQKPEQKPVSATPGVGTITAASLDALARGLAAEDSLLRRFEAEMTALKTPDEYHACTGGLMLNPEMQALYEAFEKDQAAGVANAAEKLQNGLKQLLLKECGRDPTDVNKAEVSKRILAEATSLAGLEPTLYATLKERVVPFCRANVGGDGEDVRLKGDGSAWWVYSAAEADVLRPRCGALMTAIAAVS